ncbi:MAG: hypothetical protein V4721_10495 [Bacteroidota bacterium]
MKTEEEEALTELLTFCFEPGEISGRSNINTAIAMLGTFLGTYRPVSEEAKIPMEEVCEKVEYILNPKHLNDLFTFLEVKNAILAVT